MINVTVINMRSLIKYIAITCVLVILVTGIRGLVENLSGKGNMLSTTFGNVSFISCIEDTLPNRKSEIKRFE